MDNFNQQTDYTHQLNGEENTPSAKGILFAALGMLIGLSIQLTVGGFFGLRIGWIGSAAIGFLVSKGYQLGKGKEGTIKLITMIVLPSVGIILAVWFGYAIFMWNELSFLMDFPTTLDIIGRAILNSIGNVFSNFSLMFDGTLEGDILFDILIGLVISLSISLKNLNSEDDTTYETTEDHTEIIETEKSLSDNGDYDL